MGFDSLSVPPRCTLREVDRDEDDVLDVDLATPVGRTYKSVTVAKYVFVLDGVAVIGSCRPSKSSKSVDSGSSEFETDTNAPKSLPWELMLAER